MKRKRRSVLNNTKKKPAVAVAVAAEAPVDPGFYSDVDKNSDDELLLVRKEKTDAAETSSKKVDARETSTSNKLNAKETGITKKINMKETSTSKSGGQRLDSNKAVVVNNVTPGSASARLARALSSSRTNAIADKAPLLQRHTTGQKEPKSSHPATLNNKEELDAAETVIKKIMKMDAATAFNAPVDPIALGIPDYYDVIKTPMDFGTICSSLERGLEYKNSEDVYKDVQLIWENCAKYNKKGSYILELMKRVKANFMKQWTSAGLYKEQQTVSKGDLPRYAQPPFAESEMRHEDHMSPVGSTFRDPAYFPPYNPPYMNQGQHHQQFPPYYGNTYNPHMPYQYPSSSHPGSYPHGMVPQHPQHPQQHGHFPHLPPVDPINGNAYQPWAHQPSPGGTGMFNPQQRPYMHPSSSSQLPPSRLHPDMNSQSTGHMHQPYREPTSSYNPQHEHPYVPQHPSDRTHPQHYQMDSAPPPPLYHHHPSTSHTPTPQLNQSSYQQLHTPHFEGDKNIERSGNLTMPPPVEFTVNGKTKCDTERPGPMLIDNTSHHQPDKINSTPEQSSSMNNVEACDVPEHSDKNEQESSSTAEDSNISKRKSQVPEQPLIQEQSSPNPNREDHPPAENTPQNKIVPRVSQPLPLKYGSRRINRKHGKRGPTKCMLEVERIKVNTDDYGDPTGPETQKLASFLGTLARNGDYLPLNYNDWRAVPLEHKESIWEKVQVAFDIDPRSKDWVIHCLSLRWKNWKSFLKTSRYDRYETDEERLADRDERVLPEQWAALVRMWGTEAAQKRSEKNKASRAKMKFHHTTGRKSFARIREEQKEKSDGKELSRAELFILTRTRKDGTPINAETSEVIEKLKEREQLQQETPEDERKNPHDILAEIIGPNKKGGSRCAVLGTSTMDSVKPSRAEAIRMATQANTEIHEMKKKMAFMEQTCAQMASQMAAMMSMMNKNLPNEGEVPDDVVPITGATSNQSTPHHVNATPSLAPDPSPQVPATSGTSNQSTPQQENIMSYPPLDTMTPQVPVKSGTSSDHSIPQHETNISSLFEPVHQQETPMSPLFDQPMPQEEITTPSLFEPVPRQENTMPILEPVPQVRPRGRPRKCRI